MSSVGGAELLASRDLADLSLEQLANVVVTSVSGRAETLARAAASVYVISGDDIRRSGATSIPEALRQAPNLEVARTGANGYAITARGFNGTLANKLLVLVDGRAIYSPTFSGVFWEAHDVMLEDVERIEVISGPGGVLWGANAVNGVINVVTKTAADTQGTLASAGASKYEAVGSARYGSTFSNGGGEYRVYAKTYRRDNFTFPGGADAHDGGDRLQGGFRSDWRSGANGYTLQGDVYTAQGNQVPKPADLNGYNILGRWHRSLGGGDGLRLQSYVDHSTRQQQDLDTLDVDLAHTLAPRGAHTFIWGAGYRTSRDRIDNSAALALIPADKTLMSWNIYGQDEIALGANLSATLGLKIDRNAYTGEEYLPSARLGWRPRAQDLVWAAWSRAVRTPSRFDRELFLPGNPPFLVAGGPNFQSELSYVYELGYRSQLIRNLSWSVTAFYHDLQDQRSLSPAPGGAVVSNERFGNTKGFETWASWRASENWRLSGGYTHLVTVLSLQPGAVDLQPQTNFGSDPHQWWTLRSSHDIGRSGEFDVMARRSAALENATVPAYTAVDVRAGWRPIRGVELSLLIQNLFDPRHQEWTAGAELPRAAFVNVRITL
jgi:iron complex outermembrane receptor protein